MWDSHPAAVSMRLLPMVHNMRHHQDAVKDLGGGQQRRPLQLPRQRLDEQLRLLVACEVESRIFRVWTPM